ncbi:MAG: hypothetical protein ACI4SP_00965 [Eubacteriales bacterium]
MEQNDSETRAQGLPYPQNTPQYEGTDPADAPLATADTAVETPRDETDPAVSEEPLADDRNPAPDYEALAAEDLAEIHRLVPALEGITHLAELPNAVRYAALRDAGLSVEEALWAACHAVVAGRAPYDNRSHLRSSVPRGAAGNPAAMTASEMQAAKDLFGDLSEAEIERLYLRCR